MERYEGRQFEKDVERNAFYRIEDKQDQYYQGVKTAMELFKGHLEDTNQRLGMIGRSTTLNAVGHILTKTHGSSKYIYPCMDFRLGMLSVAEHINGVAYDNRLIDSLDYWMLLEAIISVRNFVLFPR